jgi:hypothetical protein
MEQLNNRIWKKTKLRIDEELRLCMDFYFEKDKDF